LPFNLTSL